MNFFKILVVFSFTTVILSGCGKITGWDFKNLKGNPRSVVKTQITEFYKGVEWKPAINTSGAISERSEEIIFGKNGMILSERNFSEDELLNGFDYYYENGLVKRIRFSGKKKEKFLEDKFYISHQLFKVSTIESKDLKSNEIIYKFTYEWDEENRVKKVIGEAKDENIWSFTEERFYKENSAPSLIVKTDSNEKYVENFIDYKYDEVGNWISRIQTNPKFKDLRTIEKRIIQYY